MNELPADLLAALPEGTHAIAGRWWTLLPEADRRQIAGLWDERVEVRFFTPQADENGHEDQWEQVPVVQGGRFISADNDGRGEWLPGYFEHLLQHPELLLAYEPARRTFHIGCTRHAAARACFVAGTVPEGFVCPVGSTSCPLHVLRGSCLTRVKLR